MQEKLKKIYSKLPKWLRTFIRFIKNVVALYMSNDIPIYSASSSFFLIISSIPLFMLFFSTISLIPQVRIEDITANITLLFPNLPYITNIVNYILLIARGLAKSNVIYFNILTAFITGSTCLFAFIVGIRKIHDINYTSNYALLKILTILNMLILYLAVILTLILLMLGGMILGFVKLYLPFETDIIDQVLSYKYLVSSIALIILTMSLYTTTTNFERSFLKNIYGAVFTTFAWIIVSNLFSIYFTRFPINTSTYGSLTGIMIVLLWIFICINIIFIGACVNEVVYPQKRIEADTKRKLQGEIESGKIQKADYEIAKRSKFTKIFKFKRPNLNKNASYAEDD